MMTRAIGTLCQFTIMQHHNMTDSTTTVGMLRHITMPHFVSINLQSGTSGTMYLVSSVSGSSSAPPAPAAPPSPATQQLCACTSTRPADMITFTRCVTGFGFSSSASCRSLVICRSCHTGTPFCRSRDNCKKTRAEPVRKQAPITS